MTPHRRLGGHFACRPRTTARIFGPRAENVRRPDAGKLTAVFTTCPDLRTACRNKISRSYFTVIFYMKYSIYIKRQRASAPFAFFRLMLPPALLPYPCFYLTRCVFFLLCALQRFLCILNVKSFRVVSECWLCALFCQLLFQTFGGICLCPVYADDFFVLGVFEQ